MSSFAVFNKAASNIVFSYNVGFGTTAPQTTLHVFGNQTTIGNVGIGTTVTFQPLHVNGATFMSGNVGMGSSVPGAILDILSTTSTQCLRILQNNNVSSFAILVTTVSTPTVPFCVTGTGRVGIGTSIPSQLLHVEGSQYVSQRLGIGTLSPMTNLHVFGDTRGVPATYGSLATVNPLDGSLNNAIVGTGTDININLSPASYKTHEISFSYYSQNANLLNHSLTLVVGSATDYKTNFITLSGGAWTGGVTSPTGTTPPTVIASSTLNQGVSVSGTIKIYNKDQSDAALYGTNIAVDIITDTGARIIGTMVVKTTGNPTLFTIRVNNATTNVKGYYTVNGNPVDKFA